MATLAQARAALAKLGLELDEDVSFWTKETGGSATIDAIGRVSIDTDCRGQFIYDYTASRSDIEAHAQYVLAALHGGRFDVGHGQGASDAAFGRFYGATRSIHAGRAEYALGWALARFVLFAGLPRWRAPVTPATALETLECFKRSQEGRAFALAYGDKRSLDHVQACL